MVTVSLPDGKTLDFPHGVTGAGIAAAIGPGLAKAAIAIKLDGEVRDLEFAVEPATPGNTIKTEIVTAKSPEALDIFRHDAAHVLAEAVQELYPGTQITFGPATETGFYYDFARDTPFSSAELTSIEAKMHEIVDRDAPITREIWPRDRAIAYFTEIGETFKAEWIASIPADQEISIYRQGSWLDMCRGPHLPSTGRLGHAFKLLKVAGAYWRGDANNAQLQRIYGTAFPTQAGLDAYLLQIAEAEKRDHRRLGREMDLFHLQEEAAGSIFWHPNGWVLYRVIENYIRERLEAAGYNEVRTPQLIDSGLFKASGHWDMYGDNMYKIAVAGGGDSERLFGLKPMNCPGHVQIFNHTLKSYRDLPLRMAEFGCCHRNESSGSLHGIMRVRQMTQDDAHIFCTEAQITDETIRFCRLLESVYRDFGFTVNAVKLATRPDIRGGSDEVWDHAEAKLAAAVKEASLPFEILPGEGAFYGPKLEFHLQDAIGRMWQCGTLQLDFVLPERLDAAYIGEDSARHRPVMLHRAILGSLERFIGILIEQYAGKLPLWLAPVQIIVATITSDADDFAGEIAALAKAEGLRVKLDLRNEKINYKVREHSLAKVPLMFVVGKREAAERKIAVRRLGGEAQEVMPLTQAIAKARSEIEHRGITENFVE